MFKKPYGHWELIFDYECTLGVMENLTLEPEMLLENNFFKLRNSGLHDAKSIWFSWIFFRNIVSCQWVETQVRCAQFLAYFHTILCLKHQLRHIQYYGLVPGAYALIHGRLPSSGNSGIILAIRRPFRSLATQERPFSNRSCDQIIATLSAIDPWAAQVLQPAGQ